MVSTSRKAAEGCRQNGGKKKPSEKPSTMKVVVRVRPLNSVESSCQSRTTAIRVMDQNVLVFDPNEDCEAINFPGASRKRTRNVCERRARDLRFIFDRVFDCQAKNIELFEHTTKEIIDGVLDGFNCTVFAYGATGAGKTFTMLGNNTNPGVMFLTMMDLYKRIHEMKDEKTCDVAVSYLEVYNETIRDLLLPGPALAVREDPQRGVCVSGLTLHKPHTAEELLSMLEFGNNNRTQHPTDANAQSSRSHAVFQVFVRQKDRTAGLQANVRLAKMSLIDLAGSERATVTTNRGARFREGANINKSLLALGNCINALADKDNKSGHIPYRDSKLTRLLKDSLGGNCRTVMIAAISPSTLSYEDTYNTLKYADRAKSIKVNLSRNEVSVDFHVSRYAKIVDELRTEISELKTKLSNYEAGGVRAKATSSSDSPSRNETNRHRLKNLLRSIMNEREIIKKDMVDVEAAQRDLMVKAFRKERDLERLRQLCVDGDTTREKAALKTHKCLSVTKTKKKKLETRIRDAETRLKQNTASLDRVQEEIKSLSEEVDERLISCQSALKAELECAEWRRQCRYYKKYAQAQEKDANNTERLVLKMLAVVKNQFLLLKGAGLATPDVSRDYDSIIGLMSEGREVSWADQSAMETDSHSMSNFINFDLVVDGTPVRPLILNEATGVESQSTATSSIAKQLLKTPNYFENQSRDSPVGGNPRLSLCKEFDAVTSPAQVKSEVPSKRSSKSAAIEASCNLNETYEIFEEKTPSRGVLLENRPRTATPLRDVNGNEAPLELISKRNPTPKIAWNDLPTRAPSPALRGSGELNISGVTPAVATPRIESLSGKSNKLIPPSSPFTPLRELSLNSRKVVYELHAAGLTSMYDTPSKKPKLTEKPHRKATNITKSTISTSMMPKRSETKENRAPSINKKTLQRHMTGVKRAVSATGLTSSRNFVPRSSAVYSNMKNTMI